MIHTKNWFYFNPRLMLPKVVLLKSALPTITTRVTEISLRFSNDKQRYVIVMKGYKGRKNGQGIKIDSNRLQRLDQARGG